MTEHLQTPFEGWGNQDPHRDHHYRMQYAIFGLHGDNGLTGTVKKLKTEVEEISRWKRQIATTILVVRWLLVTAGIVAATTNSAEGVWSALGAFIGAAGKAAGS